MFEVMDAAALLLFLSHEMTAHFGYILIQQHNANPPLFETHLPSNTIILSPNFKQLTSMLKVPHPIGKVYARQRKTSKHLSHFTMLFNTDSIMLCGQISYAKYSLSIKFRGLL